METRVAAFVLLFVLVVMGGCAAAAPSRDASSLPVGSPAENKTSGSVASERADAPAAPSTGQAGAAQTDWDRYVIRSAEVRLVVKDVEAGSGEVARIATEAGGYVAQSNTRRENQRVVADITIQVPADSFEKVVDQLCRLALTVESARTSTQDVTEEFVDNEARLRNLRAAEQSTLKLLDQTTKMEDILSVRRELTNIRGEIEKIEGRQNYLKRRVEMSTISVHLTAEAGTALAADRSSWQPLTSATVAWEASLNFIGRAVELLVVAVVFLWWLIPLGAIVWGVWRWRRRRRQAKSAVLREEPPSARPQPQGSA